MERGEIGSGEFTNMNSNASCASGNEKVLQAAEAMHSVEDCKLRMRVQLQQIERQFD